MTAAASTTPPRGLSVTVPVTQALDRVKKVLFQPFDIGRWFIIGFCAWLATLGQRGFSGGFNFGGGHHWGHAGTVRDSVEHVRSFVVNNIGWIAPLAIALLLFALVVGLVILFVSSRGRFMFLHCVALNRAEIQVPWYRYAAEANSLFRLRLVIALISAVTALPLAGALLFVVLRMFMSEHFQPGAVLISLALGAVLFVVSIVFWVISRILADFIVPLQFLRRSACVDAWREFKSLMRGHGGSLVVYLLFRIALAIAIALVIGLLVIATCCIAGCFLAIPYIGTVLLLPVLVFERAYSLHYLAQFGPDYDVFGASASSLS